MSQEQEIESERKQAAEQLREALARETGFMVKCLMVAMKSFQAMADTEGEIDDGQVWLGPAFEVIEKEFEQTLSPEASQMLESNLFMALASAGGMTMCAIWTYAHAIEHAVRISQEAVPAGVTVQ